MAKSKKKQLRDPDSYSFSVETLRSGAYEVMKANAELKEGDEELMLGLDAGAMLAICNVLESAGVSFVGQLPEDEDARDWSQLEMFDEDEHGPDGNVN